MQPINDNENTDIDLLNKFMYMTMSLSGYKYIDDLVKNIKDYVKKQAIIDNKLHVFENICNKYDLLIENNNFDFGVIIDCTRIIDTEYPQLHNHITDFIELHTQYYARTLICQRQVKKWLRRRNRAARIIQKGCHNWLYKGQTKDSKMGIICRLSIKELEDDINKYHNNQ